MTFLCCMHEFIFSVCACLFTRQEKLARVRMLQAELMSEPTTSLSAASPEPAAPAPSEMLSIYTFFVCGRVL